MARKKRKALLFSSVALLLAAGAAFAMGFVALYAEAKLRRLVLGGLGESFSTRIYAAPYVVPDGAALPPERLLARLSRLGYRQGPGSELQPGQLRAAPDGVTVCLRGFKTPLAWQDPGLFTLAWNGRAWTLKTASGAAVERLSLEPELAAELSGARKIRREPAESAEIPTALKHAVVAAEDKRFYTHWGLDARAVLRALGADLLGRGAMQGGSTITQQLSKNLFLSPKRTLKRKLVEAALALYLELRWSKDKILTVYLNHIYLGQDGPVSVAGVKSAARFYFGKPLGELSTAQCAALAGLIRSPRRYNPNQEPDEALERRNFVLKRMREEGFLGAAELAQAINEPLGTAAGTGQESLSARRDNDYFVAEVVRQLTPRYGEDALYRQGLSIYTTMDPLLQGAAQKAACAARPQGALVALDPASGRVRALSGGRDFARSQFNRATQALRQPGSAFKPFLYGAALEKGLTAATLLADAPRRYPRPRTEKPWDPRNYDGVYMGSVTLRVALAHSLNAASLDLAEKTGTSAAIAFAHRMGVKSSLEDNLATMLGASEVNLLELTAAYAPFANGGFRVEPRLVDAVLDAEGDVLETASPAPSQALEPAQSYLMTSLLQSVIADGTAKALPLMGFSRPAAGKTGTTNDGRDAWFVGYTPRLLAGVWVGDDKHKALKATGAKTALPLWARFMNDASRDYAVEDFPQPAGLVTVAIDPSTGLRAVSGCPQKRPELFIAGTQPTTDCPLHASGLKGWFRKLFRGGKPNGSRAR